MLRFCRRLRHHLLGKQFIIRTDHSSLTWFLRFNEQQGQLARWMEELSQYDMVLEHRLEINIQMPMHYPGFHAKRYSVIIYSRSKAK